MKSPQSFRAIGAAAGLVAIVLAGMLVTSPRAQAQETEATLSQLGLAIAPVPLNLTGANQTMVGLGSYLVNAIGDCNGCHSSGEPPIFVYPYAPGGNPYFNQPEKLDPAIYLNGGTNFGPVGTPTGPLMYAGPDIITRNLTPDKTGMAAGGLTLAQFLQIIKSGADLDMIHPNCTAAQLAIINDPNVTPAQLPNCIPTSPGNTPDGNLLQIMPWVTFSHMSDYDIESIYAYLSAIPCIDNTTSMAPAGAPNELVNTCPTGPPTPPANPITIVITGPGGVTSASNTFVTSTGQFSLNASQSTSVNPGALSFAWQIAPGYPTLAIPGGFTATPILQISRAGTYEVILTVTDSTGATATATVIVQYG
jgi:hypothetical protein